MASLCLYCLFQILLKNTKLQVLVTCRSLANLDLPKGIITITITRYDEKLTNHGGEISQVSSQDF